MRQTRARNKEDKDAKRLLIMDSAIELFLTYGSMPMASSIAQSSNMTKSNFYIYFKSREELYFEILKLQYRKWFEKALNLLDFGYEIDTRVFEEFYNNELLIKLNILYHSTLKYNLKKFQQKEFENLIREKLDILTVPISRASKKHRGEIRILIYSSISLIVGAYQFQTEFRDDFDYITPEEIYLPRLKAMWDIF